MKLADIMNELPMGLGYMAHTIIASKLPELAAKSDVPITGMHIDFADGSVYEFPKNLFEGENATASDDRPGLAGDGGPLPGAPLLAG